MENESIVKSNAPLPVFCWRMRALYSFSVRDLSRVAGVSAAVISRMERGLAKPSPDVLYRWSAGLSDGQPNPEVWIDAVDPTSATWLSEAEFLLVRMADTLHDPDVCWSLSRRVTRVCLAVHAIREPSPRLDDARATYVHVGGSRYPRFASATFAPEHSETAQRAAWFALFRRSSPAVYAEASIFLSRTTRRIPNWWNPYVLGYPMYGCGTVNRQ